MAKGTINDVVNSLAERWAQELKLCVNDDDLPREYTLKGPLYVKPKPNPYQVVTKYHRKPFNAIMHFVWNGQKELYLPKEPSAEMMKNHYEVICRILQRAVSISAATGYKPVFEQVPFDPATYFKEDELSKAIRETEEYNRLFAAGENPPKPKKMVHIITAEDDMMF